MACTGDNGVLNGGMSIASRIQLQDGDTPQGLAFAVTAYVMWGIFPLYIKLLSHISPLEVLVHRVLWSVPIAAAVLIWMGRTRDFRAALRDPKMLGMHLVLAILISVNWGIYIWAVVNDRVLDTALAYYINPLFSVFLAAVLLRERLTRLQWSAIGLAALAVVVLTVEQGNLPWVSIALPVLFGLYGYFKKQLAIGPNQGFLLEILILVPPALLYWVWLGGRGESTFTANLWLFLGCGVITALPLLFYGNAAKLLRLSTLGILQYIAPTLIFLLGVFLYNEPFGIGRAIAFPMIWLALVLYTISMLRGADG